MYVYNKSLAFAITLFARSQTGINIFILQTQINKITTATVS